MEPEPPPNPGERVYVQRDDEPAIEYYRWKSRLRLAESRASVQGDPHEPTNKK